MAQVADELPPDVPIRVLVVDDDPLVRYTYRALLQEQTDVQVVWEASSGEEAIAVAERAGLDLVLMDLRMEGTDGLQAIRVLAARCPRTPILAISVLPENPYALEALKAGASGYLSKHDVVTHLSGAIRAVARGETYLPPNVALTLLRRVVDDERGKPARPLTAREAEVLRLLAQGKSNKEIAVALRSTVRTVKAHVSRILAKLQVQDRTQAAILAVRLGLADFPVSRGTDRG